MKAKHGEAAHNSSRDSKEIAVHNMSPVKLELDSPTEPPNDPHHQNELAGENEPPCQNELPYQNDPLHQKAHNSSRDPKETAVNNMSPVEQDSPPEPPCPNDPLQQNELADQNEQPCQNVPPCQYELGGQNEPAGQDEPPSRLVNNITLPNYKRASTTSINCIFQQCTNNRLHLVPVYIKQQLIQKHNFYIPPSCRMCETHIFSNQLHLLPQTVENHSTFNGKDVSDLFDILRAKVNLLDFEKVIEMPNHICKYWTELTVPQFLNLFERLPNLNIEHPKRALAIYLIKRRSGDSYGRLADLFKIPRLTMKLIVGKVKLCLKDVNDSTVTELLRLNIHSRRYD